MPRSRFEAIVGQSFQVEMRFTLGGTLYDPVSIRTGLFSPSMVALETVTPTRVSAGVWRAVFSAVTQPGRYHDYWYYRTLAGTAEEIVAAHIDVEGTVAVQNETEASTEPDIGLESTCLLTHRFVTSGGMAANGVEVIFSPILLSSQIRSGYSARDDVTVFSGTDGFVEMRLLRGLVGLLTVVGFHGMCRQVTIPDEEEVDIFDLISDAEDVIGTIRTSTDLLLYPRRM